MFHEPGASRAVLSEVQWGKGMFVQGIKCMHAASSGHRTTFAQTMDLFWGLFVFFCVCFFGGVINGYHHVMLYIQFLLACSVQMCQSLHR